MKKQAGKWAMVAIAFVMGALSVQFLPRVYGQTQNPKGPEWFYGLSLNVRKANEKSFKDAKVVGVEVFRDENNGNLIYISETGSIAVLPGK